MQTLTGSLTNITRVRWHRLIDIGINEGTPWVFKATQAPVVRSILNAYSIRVGLFSGRAFDRRGMRGYGSPVFTHREE